MKKHIVMTLMSTLLIGLSAGEFMDVNIIHADETNLTEDNVVVIPDENLQKELQRALGTGVPLTKENLLKVTSLNLTYSDITDLTGLEYAKNLKLIDLSGNAIASIEPLGQLHHLESVSLRFNKSKVLPDLAPLKTTSVAQLNLVANAYGLEPDKLSAVSDLTNLVTLEMQNTKLSVVPDLSKLTKLRSLGMGGNQLTDVSALASMTELTELEINSNQITNFEPVSHLTNLERIALGNNRSADVSSLKSLTKLKKANFSQMGLSNNEMSIFAGMKDLEILAIDFNDQISDLSSLSKLTKLSDLDFSKDNVSSLTPLAELKNLKYLGFSNNNVSDISVLKELSGLETINMMRNHIYDLSALKDLTKITRVNAKFQAVTLPVAMINDKKASGLIPVLVKSRNANVLPIKLQSDGQLTVNDEGLLLTDIDVNKDNEVYMSWETDAEDKAIKFTGTLTQPVQLKGADKTDENQAVKISVLKGDGSNLTSVASNFIQTNAVVETQADGQKTLLIKVIVPKTYGADSITFLHGTKVSTKLVGETYVLEYRFALTEDALNGTPFKENMHVKINPEVLNYDHHYDVFFKLYGLTNDADKDAEQPAEPEVKPNPDEEATKPETEDKPEDVNKDTESNNDVTPSKEQDVVTYKAHYLKVGTNDTSVMAQYMLKSAQMYYQNGHQYLVISANDDKAAAMIQNMLMNEKSYVKRESTKFYFDLGTKKLQNDVTITLNGFVSVSAYIPGLGQFKEEQPFTLQLDERTVQENKTPEKQEPEKQEPEKQTPEKQTPETPNVPDKPQDVNKDKEPQQDTKPSKEQDLVTYKAHYLKLGTSDASVMAQYMLKSAQMYYQNGHQYLVVSANNDKAAAMIQNLMLNGKSYVKREGTKFYFDLGTKKLQNDVTITLDGFVSVSTFIPGLGQFKEEQPFTLRLDGRTVQKGIVPDKPVEHDDADKQVDEQKNKPEKESEQDKQPDKTKPNKSDSEDKSGTPNKNNVTPNKYHNYVAKFLKLGTDQISVMAQYMLNAAHVEIKGNQATITIFANNEAAANMITRLMIGGQKAVSSGNSFTVTLPKSVLTTTIVGHVDVDVPGVIKESQPFSLRLIAGFKGTPKTEDAVHEEVAPQVPTQDGQVHTNNKGVTKSRELRVNKNTVESADATTPIEVVKPLNNATTTNQTDTVLPMHFVPTTKVDANLDDDMDSTDVAKASDTKEPAKNTMEQLIDAAQSNDAAMTNSAEEQADINNAFLLLGSVIAALLGFISVTLAWLMFKG